ncbi:TetR/AcrR family transcriptional regulator [Umezawaea endophytica]|uniref:TetR/AcrR family transcriptional regulator n=1 Tax=Umezawaea endophytica TaxID=1654476 RepID=A0A9X2VIF7_9PSEU|nr:TetR/AcrR family transcriptional regulator [Umezawaea endophytica]MCS7477146.1 TetR/AcrR family transcriptional regulator [Umezawaea endophytica]
MSRVNASTQTPGRRRRSEGKRVTVLDAAEALFVEEGYDAAGVDEIAARAQVSKRTVYDHFADKEEIFLQVLERVSDALTGAVRAAIDEELSGKSGLRDELANFANRVVGTTLRSSQYAKFRMLESRPGSRPGLPESKRDLAERMLSERFAGFAESGRLRAVDPGVAARHFTALTIKLALEDLVRERSGGSPDLRKTVSDGVEAFLRAYG